MDDSCVVCADSLEWVAYGACGHKDVCSTCVARLRVICDDRRCCICKTESNVIFVTKALGDYTRMISDFSVFPSEVREGRVGSYWYNEDTQAFFDDVDHYKMIEAMCRLSCSVCDKIDEQQQQPADASRRRAKFRNIEQLKGHLFHKHKLLMCSLCLEGRKVFICEQKLYTRAQLNQHINTGDSDVDGSESERGGFTGHPLCEFCRTPFYGDNELYSHMTTEHFTCHFCKRQHPGQFEYYKDYDDLEIHFRQDHFLCEDEGCLAKKFVVFLSEAELKKHNTIEHGGRMSRSKRSAALQIPTSFRYRRSNEQENRRGRGRMLRHDTSEAELSLAIQASLETANLDGRSYDASSSTMPFVSGRGETSDVDIIIPPFESLSTADSEPPSRYLQAVSQTSRNGPLEESSFPPLPVVPSSNHQRSHPDNSSQNTMAAHLRRQNKRNVNVPSSSPAWPLATRSPLPPAVIPDRAWPAVNGASVSSSTSSQRKLATESATAVPTYSSSLQVRPTTVHESPVAGSSSRSWGSINKISHSASAPNLVEKGSFDSSVSAFPPVSAVQTRKLPATGNIVNNAEDVHTANKSLVERIRAALQFDEDRYSGFKDISGEYRRGSMDTETYLVYVEQFGLSHLVPELARLCPDAQKQKELLETYKANMSHNGPRENGSLHVKAGNHSKKSKGKSVEKVNSAAKDDLTDNILNTVRELQSHYKPSEEEVEVLAKDGYRVAKGKSKAVVDESQVQSVLPGESIKLKEQLDSSSASVRSNQYTWDGDGKSKPRKKTSKFYRVRLGDGSAAALLDLKNSNPDTDPDSDVDLSSSAADGQTRKEGLPVRGVWRNGGGQKLLSTSRGPTN